MQNAAAAVGHVHTQRLLLPDRVEDQPEAADVTRIRIGIAVRIAVEHADILRQKQRLRVVRIRRRVGEQPDARIEQNRLLPAPLSQGQRQGRRMAQRR